MQNQDGYTPLHLAAWMSDTPGPLAVQKLLMQMQAHLEVVSRHPKPETQNPTPEARNPKPKTRSPNPEVQNPKSNSNSPSS